MLESSLDMLALEIFETQRGVPAVSHSRPGAEFSRQVFHADDRLPPSQNECPL
jgi:hypothetical protein